MIAPPAGRPPTGLLYLSQPELSSFAARVLEVRPWPADGACWAVVLDRTAFYPGGGGQAPDRGTIAGLPVAAALPDPLEPGIVLHLLEGAAPGEGPASASGARPPLEPGQEVSAAIDWPYRFDLMQHHTAQHILSAVAMRDCGAQTTGFHLSGETATVDLAAGPGVLADPGEADRWAEGLELAAAAEVFANRPVEVSSAPADGDPTALAGPLRVRQRGPRPKGGQTWRIVGIAGLDQSPCGGTHVASTGQVGLIAIQRWEKVRDGLRLEYAAGHRSLAAARWRRQALRRLGQALCAHERDAAEVALRQLHDAWAQAKELPRLRQELLRYQAQDIAAAAERWPGGRLLALVRPDSGPEDLKVLAAAACAGGGLVALLAGGRDPPRLVFARSDDLDAVDARQLLAAALAVMGGRGGGAPKLAQGGGGDPGRLDHAMAEAAKLAREALAAERPR